MKRRVITIDGELYRELQQFRANLIGDGTVDEISFTTVANMVLRGGLIAADRLHDEDWEDIIRYWRESGPSLELDSYTDRQADEWLGNLQRIGEVES